MKRTRTGMGLGARALALGVVALGLAGCSHDYWVRFGLVTDAPASVVVNSDQIEIPVGYAVAVHAWPMRDEEQLSSSMEVDLQSLRPGMLGVDHGVREREFVIFGSQVGTTTVDVYFGGSYVDEITARVVPAGP
jgi:hypothetical protein